MKKTSTLPLQGVSEDSFASAVARLPTLPKIIVYEDDYNEKMCSVETDNSFESATISDAGSHFKLNFYLFEERVRTLIRFFLLSSLMDYAPASVASFYKSMRTIPAGIIEEIALLDPQLFRARWPALSTGINAEALVAIKRFTAFLCQIGFERWEQKHKSLVSSLPTSRTDIYAVVRSGDCFLAIEEESQLVRWIDQAVIAKDTLPASELQVASLIVCAYQFGMRPKQLGTLRKRDCEVRWSNEDGLPSVYLTFRMLKQRDPLASRLPLLRKVKREWAPLLAATFSRLEEQPPSAFFFGFNSRLALSNALIGKLNEILPGMGRVAYDLRHSMAQRMVDAGASQEEIAAALGHTHLTSGLIYFRASANQAERVNKALGLSETYRTVVRIAADGFISTEDLAQLKGEQQIAGVPHGIPIAGIGGCKTGQPSCPYNPVTACYGCPKFMPVRDLALHEQVLNDFRHVVNEFRVAGLGEQESPAYMQLRRTISEIQGVINQIEGRDVQ